MGSANLRFECSLQGIKIHVSELRLFQNPVGADQRSDETTSWEKRSNRTKVRPLFPLNLRLLFQKLKFWNSLNFYPILR